MDLSPELLAISSFRLLGFSEPEKPVSHFGGCGRARGRRPSGREGGDKKWGRGF